MWNSATTYEHSKTFETRRLHREIVQAEHHLVDRRMVERAGRIYRLDDHIERQIAVVDRFDRGAADLRQITRETRISRDAQSQGKAVDERSDDLLEFSAAPVRHGRSDHDLVLSSQAMQNHAKGGKHGHVERGVMAFAQLQQILDHVRLDDTIDPTASK